MSESNPLGPWLKPPAGGLLRLRHAVEGHRSEQTPRRAYWLGTGLASTIVVLAALLTVFVWKPGHQPVRERKIHAAVERVLSAPPNARFAHAGYIELPTQQRNVRILLVASLPSPQP